MHSLIIFFTRFSFVGHKELVSLSSSCCVKDVIHTEWLQIHHRATFEPFSWAQLDFLSQLKAVLESSYW